MRRGSRLARAYFYSGVRHPRAHDEHTMPTNIAPLALDNGTYLLFIHGVWYSMCAEYVAPHLTNKITIF
jgi:hypothetical protein